MATPFVFKCPVTSQNVQGLLDDDDDVPEDRYDGITCPACTRMHFLNHRTGKMLGQNSEQKISSVGPPENSHSEER